MKSTLSFLAGCVIAALLIVALPISADTRYAALRGDAARLSWIRERVEVDPRPIDVAFLGSSHTLNGIVDQEIEGNLKQAGQDVSVVNLGTVFLGRNLQLYWLKQLLAAKKPRLVVIELTEHEYEFGHLLLPYIGNLPDHFCCDFYRDPYFPKYFALYLKLQTTYALQTLTGALAPPLPVEPKEHGWWPNDKHVTPAAYQGAVAEANVWKRLKETVHRAAPRYGLDIVAKMSALAKSNGVPLAFVYLPSVGYVGRAPLVDRSRYAPYGPVIEFPPQIGTTQALWADEAHLNRAGAERLAPLLASDIAKLLADAKN